MQYTYQKKLNLYSITHIGGYIVENSKHQSDRNVWHFFFLTFIYSWTLWLPFVLEGLGLIKPSETLAALMTPAIILGAFAPLLAAVTMIARQSGWSEVKQFFRQSLSFRVKAIYVVLSLLLPLIITAGTHYIANFSGIDSLPNTFLPENLPVPTIILIIPYFVLMLVVGGGQEEFGWRGYAQEPLQQRLGIFWGSIVLGVVWGIWHLPLWLMPGEGHSYYPFLAFLIYTISTSLIMAWLYNASGKKLIIPWIIHAMGNTVVPFFPILHLANVAQPGYWLWVGINALIALCITIWFWSKAHNLNSQ